jgi:hypothetical protein
MTRARDISRIYTRTAAEIAAGVTPTDTSYPSNDAVGWVDPQRYGYVADDSTDNTAAILAAKAVATALLPYAVIQFPSGRARYGNIGNMGMSGITYRGAGDGSSVLVCTRSDAEHTAFLLWAFEADSLDGDATPEDPFLMKCNLENIKVEGNATTKYTIRGYGLARCSWKNVTARNARTEAAFPGAGGRAFDFSACSINMFENLMCSTDFESQSSQPYVGIWLDTGTREGVGLGASTDNTFINPVMEGMGIGIRCESADGNTFIGGTSESCTVYGVVCGAGSRNNTFIGHGLENSGSTADYVDSGSNNKLINSYSTKSVILQGRSGEVNGALHERIEVQSGATNSHVHDLTVNYAGGGSGGFFDAGTATKWSGLYDAQATAFIYPNAARVEIIETASPYTWTNNTGQYVEVVIQTGTISQIRRIRGGVAFLVPAAVPGVHLLAPDDDIEITYTVAPDISYLPHNNLHG